MSYPLTSSIYLTDLDQIHFFHWAQSNIGFDLYWNKTNVVGWEDQKKEKKFLEGKFLVRSDRWFLDIMPYLAIVYLNI